MKGWKVDANGSLEEHEANHLKKVNIIQMSMRNNP